MRTKILLLNDDKLMPYVYTLKWKEKDTKEKKVF